MALIRSLLLYGCEALSILAKCHKKKIQILQNKCLKIIFQATRYTRISELHDVVNLPYIDELMEDRVHKMFHVISTHDNPLVRSVGHLYQWLVTHRKTFQGPCESEDAQTRQIEWKASISAPATWHTNMPSAPARLSSRPCPCGSCRAHTTISLSRKLNLTLKPVQGSWKSY